MNQNYQSDGDTTCDVVTWVVAMLPVETLGIRRLEEEEVEICTLVVGVTAAIRGGRSGAILVGLTAAVGVVSPEDGFLSNSPNLINFYSRDHNIAL